jgi:hypothetical protein
MGFNKEERGFPFDKLLFLSFRGICILASNDFNFWRRHYLVIFHFELRILDDERPHVIT